MTTRFAYARLGCRVVCAEDVFIHHFGKASFGSLVPTAEVAAAFHANRQRYESKWGHPWTMHERRPNPRWQHGVEGIRKLVAERLPEDAVVVIVNRGDDSMLNLGSRTGWPFPSDAEGQYAGFYPADGSEAIAMLERLRARGATHFVLPHDELWWLQHYRELREHLEARHLEIARTEAGVAYSLADHARASLRPR